MTSTRTRLHNGITGTMYTPTGLARYEPLGWVSSGWSYPPNCFWNDLRALQLDEAPEPVGWVFYPTGEWHYIYPVEGD